MRRALLAGALYFAIVFVFAFAFGAVRTFWLEPALGETWAVACEAPLLITAFFFAAPFAAQRAGLGRDIGLRLVMGLFGLALQQIAELGLVLAAGETVAEHIAYLRTPAGMIYLFALAVFVIMPVLRRGAARG
jgi:hypothetical protein